MIDTKEHGPYTLAQIDHLVNSGLVGEEATYWREGMEDWLPVTTLVKVRKPANRWMRTAILAGFLVVALLAVRLLGPTILEGWRESTRYDEFSDKAAYWSARDAVRRGVLPTTSAVSFGPFKTAKITLKNAPVEGASVFLPAEVSGDRGTRAMAWDVELSFDPKSKQWSSVSVKESAGLPVGEL